jgi:hypothetical protein
VFYRSSLVNRYSIIQGLNLSLGTEFRYDIVLYKTRNTIAHPSIKVTTADSKTDVRGGRDFLKTAQKTEECTTSATVWITSRTYTVSADSETVPEMEDSPNCADEEEAKIQNRRSSSWSIKHSVAVFHNKNIIYTSNCIFSIRNVVFLTTTLTITKRASIQTLTDFENGFNTIVWFQNGQTCVLKL